MFCHSVQLKRTLFVLQLSTSCRLTAVGYGDLVPRTSIGKVFCICVVIISTIYSAMPVSLVGSKFYELYEKHMEKMVVKRVCTRLNMRISNY